MSRTSVNRGTLEVDSPFWFRGNLPKKSSPWRPRARNPITKPSKEDELVEVHTCPTCNEASIFERVVTCFSGSNPPPNPKLLWLHPWKLTCPLKIDGWKMYSLLHFWVLGFFQGDEKPTGGQQIFGVRKGLQKSAEAINSSERIFFTINELLMGTSNSP